MASSSVLALGRSRPRRFARFLFASAASAVALNSANALFCDAPNKTPPTPPPSASSSPASAPGVFNPALPTFSRAQLAEKNGGVSSDAIWVRFGRGVYDITDFVERHPGGRDRIMLAAGADIAPFWAMYAQHKDDAVYEMLEEMRIGNINEEGHDGDQESRKAAAAGPYASEPQRHPALIVRSQTPFNAEPPMELLSDSVVTPNELFYVRNHLPVPVVDAEEYRLRVEVADDRCVEFTLDDLKTKFPQHTVTATIQCAGNRRNEMTETKPVKGGYWGVGAISTATWSGPRLSDVMAHVGLSSNDAEKLGLAHLQFEGLDGDPATSTTYGASIPIEIGLDPRQDCLLAHKMNGVDIPRDHGFPVRAVVPGIVGARNVKWVGKVTASKDESDSHWQQSDYKGFNASIDWHNVDFTKMPAIQEMPVQSAICTPVHGSSFDSSDSEVEVKGFAWSGGGRGVIRVDVSSDGGETWHDAALQTQEDSSQGRNRVWSWVLWEATVPLPQERKADGTVELVVKAVDSQYNNQPESVGPIWNLRGVLNNAWHRVTVVPSGKGAGP